MRAIFLEADENFVDVIDFSATATQTFLVDGHGGLNWPSLALSIDTVFCMAVRHA